MSQPFEEFPLQSAIEASILMHRDVHFGGNFNIMLKYYEEGGKGISDAFDSTQIRRLAEMERESGGNLAASILTGADAEKVADAKKAYQQLRDLFKQEGKEFFYPQLIASLILSEEEEPMEEIQAIVAEKQSIVPSLLEVLKSENFYHPLFPGYGQAPALAAKCLGLIGDKRAMISLFEGIGRGNLDYEDSLLQAIKAIGTPAKDFLLAVLRSQPINEDNERAAIALSAFECDPQVAESCYDLLQQIHFDPRLSLTSYLIFGCEGLQDEEKRRALHRLIEAPDTPKELKLDLRTIVGKWT